MALVNGESLESSHDDFNLIKTLDQQVKLLTLASLYTMYRYDTKEKPVCKSRHH